jgi:hypothetical protein
MMIVASMIRSGFCMDPYMAVITKLKTQR